MGLFNEDLKQALRAMGMRLFWWGLGFFVGSGLAIWHMSK